MVQLFNNKILNKVIQIIIIFNKLNNNFFLIKNKRIFHIMNLNKASLLLTLSLLATLFLKE
jgi:hypothetical protein